MIHYYCYMPSWGKITASTKVFKVAVGSSSADQVAKQCVEAFAKRTDRYFNLWNAQAELEISSRLIQGPCDPNSIALGYQCIHVPVRTLWRAILDQTVYLLKDDPNVGTNYRRMLSILSPSFFFSQARSCLSAALPPSPRKNLSVRPSTDDYCAAFGFGALVFLYWLGSLVCQWEQSFY